MHNGSICCECQEVVLASLELIFISAEKPDKGLEVKEEAQPSSSSSTAEQQRPSTKKQEEEKQQAAAVEPPKAKEARRFVFCQRPGVY